MASWLRPYSFASSLIAGGLFKGIEIGPLHIFNDREFERLAVGGFEQHDGNFVQACALRRAPAPLAGDDLIAVLRLPDCAHHDRLDNPALLDGGGQLIELGIGKIPARVAGIGFDVLDRDAPGLARALDRLRLGNDVPHERGKAASKS